MKCVLSVHDYQGSISSYGFLSTDGAQQGCQPASYLMAVNKVIFEFPLRDRIGRASITLRKRTKLRANPF